MNLNCEAVALPHLTIMVYTKTVLALKVEFNSDWSHYNGVHKNSVSVVGGYHHLGYNLLRYWCLNQQRISYNHPNTDRETPRD